MIEAGLSGGFAVHLAFRDVAGHSTTAIPIVLGFGVVWGCIILTIDRLMVLGLEGVHGRGLILPVVIRIVLAGVLGYVMATPLAIAIFSPDLQPVIDAKRAADATEKYDEAQSYNTDYVVPAQSDRNSASIKYNTLLANQAAEGNPDWQSDPAYVSALTNWQQAQSGPEGCDDYTTRVALEMDGTLPADKGGSGKFGDGRNADALRQIAQAKCRAAQAAATAKDDAAKAAKALPPNLDDQITAAKKNLSSAQDVLDSYTETYLKKLAEAKVVQDTQGAGLLASLRALSDLTSKDSLVATVHWFLVALLLGIELAPVLFKAVNQGTTKGHHHIEYEKACKTQDEQEAERLSVWQIETTNGATIEASLISENAENMRKKQIKLQDQMNKRIVRTQRDLMDEALDAWENSTRQGWVGHTPEPNGSQWVGHPNGPPESRGET